MLNKIIMSLVIVGLLNLACFSQTTTRADDSAAKIRAGIGSIGTNVNTTITFKDGRKLKGYVKTIKTESFVFVTSKKDTVTEIQYSELEKVKLPRKGPGNLEKVASVAAIIGVTVGIFGLLGLIVTNTSDY